MNIPPFKKEKEKEKEKEIKKKLKKNTGVILLGVVEYIEFFFFF